MKLFLRSKRKLTAVSAILLFPALYLTASVVRIDKEYPHELQPSAINIHAQIAGVSKGGDVFASKLSPATLFYDTDGDGVMEYYYQNFCYKIKDGAPVEYKKYDINYAGNNSYILKVGDYNRDGIPDLLYRDYDFSSGYSWLFHMIWGENQGSGRIERDLGTEIIDLNSDGMIDLLNVGHYRVNNGVINKNKHSVSLQGRDGQFTDNVITFFTPQTLKDSIALNQAGGTGNSFMAQDRNDALSMDWFIPPASTSSIFKDLDDISIDINKDGKTDFFSNAEDKRGLMSNIGNNNFLRYELGGRFFSRDLNNDQIMDYMHYDGTTVKSMIFNPAEGKYEEEILSRDMKLDMEIYFLDFDKDGDIDVLLPYSNYNGTYAYLIVAENDGNGKFLTGDRYLHENYFQKQWVFIGCADINNDGNYEVLASDKAGYVYLLNYENDFRFVARAEPLTAEGFAWISEYTPFKSCILYDVDNDGKYELLTENYSRSKISTYQFESSSVNQRPSPPAKPIATYEPSTGILKISWEAGTDKESTPAELSYAMRIGTYSGGQDVLVADATSEGRRLNLKEGNMGYHLNKQLQTDTWGSGTFYVAVQSIDPNRSGSVWSDECVVNISSPHPSFTLSNLNPSTSDTVTIYTTSHSGYTCEWMLDNANVVENNADNTQMKVFWAKPGKKTIRLTLSSGDYIIESEQSIDIASNKFVENTINGNGYGKGQGHVDVNGDGFIDRLDASDGVMLNDGNGKFVKIPLIYNNNLLFKGQYQIVDFNRDGQPDIWSSTNKGNALTNRGEGNFVISNKAELFSDWRRLYDFNNDGLLDYGPVEERVSDRPEDQQNWKYYFYINEGDYLNFKRTELRHDGDRYAFYFNDDRINFIDWNKDGWMDFFYDDTYSNKMSVYLNKGGVFFEKFIIEVPDVGRRGTQSRIEDFDGDGYPDLYLTRYGDRPMILKNNGNKQFEPVITFDLPFGVVDRLLLVADLDNNGYSDLVFEQYYSDESVICYFSANWEYTIRSQKFEANGQVLADHNCDGTMDIGNELNLTKITNNAPDVPQGLRAHQTDTSVILSWNKASDKETGTVFLKYNIGVQKKGKSGAGSYVISPMNNNSNKGYLTPNYSDYLTNPSFGPRYYNGNRIEIPLSALPEGDYELTVQTIDLWQKHSEMSEPLTFSVQPVPLVQLEQRICAGNITTVTYTGTASEGITPQWNWAGGKLVEQNGNDYKILWDVPGNKSVICTLGGKSITVPVFVAEPLNADIHIPVYGFAKKEVSFSLPTFFRNPDLKIKWYYKLSSSDKYYTLDVKRRGYTTDAKFMITQPGLFDVMITVEDNSCEQYQCVRQIEIVEAIKQPKISVVTLDKSTGKYRINWDAKLWGVDVNSIPAKEVIVYKQGTGFNDYFEIGRVPLSGGFFIDENSYPELHSPTYRISMMTDYNIETEKSVAHTPARINLNQVDKGVYNVSWMPYTGAEIDYYVIMRGKTSDDMKEIARVAGNYSYYVDRSATNGDYYYAINYERYVDDWIPTKGSKKKIPRGNVVVQGASQLVHTSGLSDIILANSVILRSSNNKWEITPENSVLNLFAEILPVVSTYKAVNWEIVSGKEFVTLSQRGEVRAIGNKNGQVTVRATAIDGSGAYAESVLNVSGFQTCEDLHKPEIWLDGDRLITSWKEGVSYQWFVNNVALPDADEYIHNPVTSGSYKVRISNVCGDELYSENFLYSPSAIASNTIDNVRVAPNPVRSILQILSPDFVIEYIDIVDANGRLIRQMKGNSENRQSINVQDLSEGVYFIRILGVSDKIVKRIIKAN